MAEESIIIETIENAVEYINSRLEISPYDSLVFEDAEALGKIYRFKALNTVRVFSDGPAALNFVNGIFLGIKLAKV